MLMNYHGMTMNEPRDAPARRQQFLVICTVMAAFFLYSATTSGLLMQVGPAVVTGTFPGGDFVYKYTERDYAASNGLAAFVAKEAGLKRKKMADKIYMLFMDDPNTIGNGRRHRFAVGYLQPSSKPMDEGEQQQVLDDQQEAVVVEAEDGEKEETSTDTATMTPEVLDPSVTTRTSGEEPSIKTLLLEKNQGMKPLSEQEIVELGASSLWPRLKYHSQPLPKVKAAIVQFPYTDGFVSALMLSLKVLPALRRVAKELLAESGDESSPIVVISTCSISDEMCTHYAPLEQGNAFLLGQPRTEDYLQGLPEEPFIDLDKILSTAARLIPFKEYFTAPQREEL